MTILVTIWVLATILTLLGFGVAGLLATRRLLDLVRRFDSVPGRYAAAGFRIVFGLGIIDIAAASRWPAFFQIFGLFPLIAGILLLFIGQERYHRLIDWWCGQSEDRLQLWCLSILAAGCVLAYGISGVFTAI